MGWVGQWCWGRSGRGWVVVEWCGVGLVGRGRLEGGLVSDCRQGRGRWSGVVELGVGGAGCGEVRGAEDGVAIGFLPGRRIGFFT